MATWQKHLDISHRFRDQGFIEVESGDLLQGSEKLWGAAAHAIKAAAEQRGWKHDGHAYLFRTVSRIVSNTGDETLKDAMFSAGLLHINFYEDTLDVDDIHELAQQVSDLVDIVNAVVEDYS